MENLDYLFTLPDDQVLNSFKFKALINVLKFESRFVLRDPYKSFLDLIINKIHNQFKSVIPANTILYRARINTIDFHDNEKEISPFSSEEMGPPPNYNATPGRINPEGIPYLYCAGELETAGSELRPWIGSRLTIAEIKIIKDIPIVDLTLNSIEGDDDNNWLIFYNDFSHYYSIQWPPDMKINYLPTQYFSEHFKAIGLRGIKYRSEFNVGGNNFSLFHREDYEILNTYNVETIDVSFCFYKRDKIE